VYGGAGGGTEAVHVTEDLGKVRGVARWQDAGAFPMKPAGSILFAVLSLPVGPFRHLFVVSVQIH
jgi:hypothetical protein